MAATVGHLVEAIRRSGKVIEHIYIGGANDTNFNCTKLSLEWMRNVAAAWPALPNVDEYKELSL